MSNLALALLIAIGSIGTATAQVNMQYSGQYSGEANGQYNGRVDGRANRNEGLPPSVADKANGTYQNPLSENDYNEVNAINPDARPYWQRRVRRECQY